MKTNKIMLGILGIFMVSLMISSVFAAQGYDTYKDSSRKISGKALMEDKDVRPYDLKTNEKTPMPKTLRNKGVSVSLPVNIKIPETKVGEPISFSVTVQDLHPITKCDSADLSSESRCPSSEYEYKLSVRAENGVNGKFSEDKIVLKAGEKKEVRLTLVTRKTGYHPFLIKVTGDAEARTKGAFLARDKTETNGHFFRGSGYAVNSEETKGMLVDLGILNSNGDLKGKISLYGESFAVKGKVNNGNVRFDFASKEGINYGSFSGSVKKFSTFLLLEGKLTFKDKSYKLNAISKNKNTIREITPKEKKTNARVNDLIVLKKKNIRELKDSVEQMDDEKTYIKPLKVRNKYFLWIFPTGKALDLEIVHGDKIIKKSIDEKGSLKVDDLNIQVGSLDDPENIEITAE
jgi:hypothetical protein